MTRHTLSRGIIIGCSLLLGLLSLACCCWFDPREYLIDAEHPNPQVAALQTYVSPTLGTIPPDYYTYFGFRDWWRFPLVYPYSIHAIDSLETGYLVNESQVTDYDDINSQTLGSTGVSGITHLMLDQQMLLVKTRASTEGEEERIAYALFTFSSGECVWFTDEAALFAEATARGFSGEVRWLTLYDYDALFWE